MRILVQAGRIVGAAALAAALAACSSTTATTPTPKDPASDEPAAALGEALTLGYDEGAVCIPVPTDDDLMFGDTMLRQEADGPVTIDNVTLVAAEDMVLRDAYLVRIGPGETVVGFRRASDGSGMPRAWDQRIEARGAVIEPGEKLNLVLVIDSPTNVIATAQAARVHYQYQDKRFVQDTLTEMASAKSCDGVLFD